MSCPIWSKSWRTCPYSGARTNGKRPDHDLRRDGLGIFSSACGTAPACDPIRAAAGGGFRIRRVGGAARSRQLYIGRGCNHDRSRLYPYSVYVYKKLCLCLKQFPSARYVEIRTFNTRYVQQPTHSCFSHKFANAHGARRIVAASKLSPPPNGGLEALGAPRRRRGASVLRRSVPAEKTMALHDRETMALFAFAMASCKKNYL